MMHFYSMPLHVILNLPLESFWEISNNVGRISAEEDLRMTMIVCSAFGGADKLVDGLQKERGEVIITSATSVGFDRVGFSRLRSIMGG